MSRGPPPEYKPESDIKPLLATEQHPHRRGPDPFGTIHVSPQAYMIKDTVRQL